MGEPEAFSAATCLWRFGELAEKAQRFLDAAGWFKLGLHDCLGLLDPGLRMKAAR